MNMESFQENRERNSQGLLGIGMENFQGIRGFQYVPIAPLTLIYGQNSAGKSSIHDALTLFRGLVIGSKNNKQMLERWLRRWNGDGLPEYQAMTISTYCKSPGASWPQCQWGAEDWLNNEFIKNNNKCLSILFPINLSYAVHINIRRHRSVAVKFLHLTMDIDIGGENFAFFKFLVGNASSGVTFLA